jgi:hypothetical protein
MVRDGAAQLSQKPPTRQRIRILHVGTSVAAYASGRDWKEAVESCLSNLGGAPRDALGFMYVNDAWAEYVPDILMRLRTGTGIRHWVGTAAVGISTSGQEHFEQPVLAVLLLALPPVREATEYSVP